MKVSPIIKWAGGKRQLLNELNEEKSVKKTTYVEPFLGGATFFIYVLSNKLYDRYLISDINSKLITLYQVVKNNPEKLIEKTEKLNKDYISLSMEERAIMYYKIREKFNKEDLKELELTSFFLLLNKTGFNGLYRENKKGEFNVPHGRYKNPTFLNKENILTLSELLNQKNDRGEDIVEIRHGDYNSLKEHIPKNSFIYLDPPYRPITKGGFISYTKSSFNDSQQKELKKFCDDMDKLGNHFLLSNSDPKNLNKQDNFFDNLYKDYYIKRVLAKRSINCDGKKRGEITEILVKNY